MDRTANGSYPKFNIVLAALLFLYVAAFLLQVGTRVQWLGAIRVEFLVAAALLAVAMVYRVGKRDARTGIAWPLSIFLLLVAVQVPLSVDVEHSWGIFLDRVLKFSAMAVIISRFVNNPRMLLVFLAAFLLSCFKMGQEGLVGNLSGGLVWESQGVMRLHGSTPMYRHPNSFAGMAMGTLPFIYFLFPVANRYIKIFLLVLLVLSVNIIIFSASRTAYVACIGMLCYVVAVSNQKMRIAGAGLVLAIMAAIYMPQQYKERFMSIYTGQEAEGRSSEARLQILEDATVVWMRHPLGVGVGAFPIVRDRYFGKDADTHNLYLEVATNLGIQGLVAFLVLIGAILRSLRRTVLECQRLLRVARELPHRTSEVAKIQWELSLYMAVSKAVAAYIVVRLLLGLFGMDLYEIYWWIGIGLTVAVSRLTSFAKANLEGGLKAGGN
jgi:putative inorganic carbon (HCO3(-)) transporter